MLKVRHADNLDAHSMMNPAYLQQRRCLAPSHFPISVPRAIRPEKHQREAGVHPSHMKWNTRRRAVCGAVGQAYFSLRKSPIPCIPGVRRPKRHASTATACPSLEKEWVRRISAHAIQSEVANHRRFVVTHSLRCAWCERHGGE